MKFRIRAVAVAICVAGALLAPVARADVPPIDACTTQGATCMNAGALGNRSGVCRRATCTRPDGSEGVIVYDCLLCKQSAMAGDGGTGGVAGVDETAGSTSASGNSAQPVTDASGDDGCSCSFKALGTERGVATLMAVLGVGALAVTRRRR